MERLDKPLSVLLLNQPWFAGELRQAGHSVIVAGPKQPGVDIVVPNNKLSIRFVLDKLPKGFYPDCIVYHDNSRPVSFTGLEDIADIPLIFFSVDAHHHYAWHSFFGGLFDLVLVAHKDYIPYFVDKCTSVHWFPLWASRTLIPEVEKTIEVSFRGTLDTKLHPARSDFFDKLSKHITVDARMGDFAGTYTRSKIVVNQAVKKDLNFRVFEAMMGGALLVTPRIGNGQEELFIPNEDFVTYEDGDVEDAVSKIKYYLANENERARIAANGYAKVCAYHSADKRCADLLGFLQEIKITERPYKYIGSAFAYYKASFSYKDASFVVSKEFTRYAARNVLASIERGEPYVVDFLYVVLSIAFRLRRLGLFEDSVNFLSALNAAFPDEVLYIASLADTFLKQNKVEDAQKLASIYSDQPGEYLKAVPTLISELEIALGKWQVGL